MNPSDPASSTIKAQAVKVDRMDGNDAIIHSGLQAGWQVVTAGVHVLNAGQKVTVFQSKYAVEPASSAEAAINSVVSGSGAASPVAAAKP